MLAFVELLEALFGLGQLLAGLAELLVYWPVSLGLMVTTALTLAIVFSVPNEIAQWGLGVPVVVAGVFLSYRWERSAEEATDDLDHSPRRTRRRVSSQKGATGED